MGVWAGLLTAWQPASMARGGWKTAPWEHGPSGYTIPIVVAEDGSKKCPKCGADAVQNQLATNWHCVLKCGWRDNKRYGKD
eukprot:g10430.t1